MAASIFVAKECYAWRSLCWISGRAMIIVPDDFAADTITREGDAGRSWIDALPGLVQRLCERWNLQIDGPTMHGYLSLVLPTSRNGELSALKVSWIEESTVDEAAALTAWGGRGAVHVLAVDPTHGAMLMERLDWSRSLNNVEIGEAIAIAGGLLRRLAIPAPNGLRPLQTMGPKLASEMPVLWERHGRPMPRRWLDQACELAVSLGAAAGNLLVNYDLHYADILASTREPWLAVDPKVVSGDPEFGIAQLLWQRLEDIDAAGGLEQQFPHLIAAAELDPHLSRAWTIVRCVDYWLWGLGVGLTYDPARCERILDWLFDARSDNSRH